MQTSISDNLATVLFYDLAREFAEGLFDLYRLCEGHLCENCFPEKLLLTHTFALELDDFVANTPSDAECMETCGELVEAMRVIANHLETAPLH